MEAVSELMDMVLSLFSFKEKNSMAQRSFFLENDGGDDGGDSFKIEFVYF